MGQERRKTSSGCRKDFECVREIRGKLSLSIIVPIVVTFFLILRLRKRYIARVVYFAREWLFLISARLHVCARGESLRHGAFIGRATDEISNVIIESTADDHHHHHHHHHHHRHSCLFWERRKTGATRPGFDSHLRASRNFVRPNILGGDRPFEFRPKEREKLPSCTPRCM
uniref:Uncharacterized protein n=1 Tax=Trichogramma kaykai TaxID=54128 RepID=A0ABD2VSN7_9HYME